MTGYQELLDAEMGTPPVSTVDVDGIMARQERRARYRKIGAGGAAALMVAAVVLGSAMLARHGSPAHATQSVAAPRATPAAAPAPRHTPTATTADRLTAVLAQLPAGLHVPRNAAFTLLSAAGLPDYYHVDWKYKGITYHLNISDGDQPDPTVNGCAPQFIGHGNEDCNQGVSGAGVTLQLFNPPHQTKFASLLAEFSATDGTQVEAGAYVGDRLAIPKSVMPLLVTAAQNPGFTLHP